MKTTRLTLWHLPLTSHVAYHIADGKSCETVETVVIRLETDTGHAGFGEVCPIPHYLPAYARGVAPAIEEMAPFSIWTSCWSSPAASSTIAPPFAPQPACR